MEKLSKFTILFTTTPETFLNILIIILLIDGRRKLYKMDKYGKLQLIGSTIACIIMTYFVRLFAINVLVSMLLNCAFYIVILRLVYFDSFKFKQLLLGVIGYNLMFLTVEMLFVSSVTIISYGNANINNFIVDDYKRFMYGLPTRVLQIIGSITLYKFHGLKLFFRDYKQVKTESIVILILLLVCEMGILYNFNSLNHILTLPQKIPMITELVVLSTVNVLFIRFIGTVRKEVYNNCVLQKE